MPIRTLHCATLPGIRRHGLSMLVMLMIISAGVVAATVELNPQHPQRYTVVQGDTLWAIAGRFLREPWRWTQVWKANPQIKNPDLIYPGDVIVLTSNNGSPELRVERGARRGSTVKLSPQVRSTPLEQAIPTLPLKIIQPFLTQTRVLNPQELEAAPYVVGTADDHLVIAQGEKLYARGVTVTELAQDAQTFDIFRQGQPYRNPPDVVNGTSAPEDQNISGFHQQTADSSATDEAGKTKQEENILGYEALHVGTARLDSVGDPATLTVTQGNHEALKGDRLLPVGERQIQQNFMPHAPTTPIEGRIISVLGGVTRIGQYSVVVLNLGNKQGLEVGHVLGAYQRGETVRDPFSKVRGDTVQLPDERAAILIVFRTFENVSYGLIMETALPLRLYDVVKNP